MEALQSVVLSFGIGVEEIEATVFAFVAFMTFALSVGGLVFAWKLTDVGTKAVYGKLMSIGKRARRNVTTPVKGVAKIAGKEMVKDWRGNVASSYDPNAKGVRNTFAGVMAGGLIPGNARMLRISAASQKHKSELAA